MPSGPSTTSAIGIEDASSCSALMKEIARTIGLSGQNANTEAKEALNRAIKSFNRKLWMDRLLRVDVDLAADTPEFDLPARWAGDRGWAWLLDTNDRRYLGVQWKTYTDFLREVSNDTASASIPRFFTIENRINRGVFEIYPRINSTNLALYPKLRMFYFADIATCVNDTDNMGVGGPLETAIVDEAIYRANRNAGDTRKNREYRYTADESMKKARHYDNRLRLRLGPLVGYD